MMPAVHTLVFCALQLFAAWLIYALRPGGKAASSDYYRLRAALPAVALLVLFLMAEAANNGQQIRVAVDQLRAPLAGAAEGQSVFVVGEQASNSDLVVPPYLEPVRSAEVLRDSQRQLVRVEMRGGQPRICIRNFAVSAQGLPGWMVKTGKDKDSLTPLPDGCGLAIGEVKVKLWIGRRDLEDQGDKFHVRRSFDLSKPATDNAVIIGLDRPIRANAGTCNDPQLRLMPSAALPPESTYLPAADLIFDALGRGGDRPLLAPAALGTVASGKSICAAKDPPFAWPGAGPGEVRVAGVVHRAFVPWFPAVLVFFSSFLLYWLRGGAWIDDRVEGNLVFLVQWLLTMRIMIGGAGIFNNLDQAVAPVLLDVMIAYISLPLIVVTLLMRGGDETQRIARALMAFLVLACIATLWWLGSTAGYRVPGAIAAVTMGLLLWRERSKDERPLLVQIASQALAVARRLARWRGPFALAVAVILGMTALRLLLALVGMMMGSDSRLTEHVGPLPLSLVHVPVLILGFALLVSVLQLRTGGRWWAVPLMAALAYYLINVPIRDFGGIPIYAWPVGAVIAWYCCKPLWAAKQKTSALLMLCTGLAPLTIFALAYGVGRTEVPQPTRETLAEHMQSALDWDANFIRLLRYSAPEKVERIGNQKAFENMDQAASLEPLVAGMTGQGFLEPSRVRNPLLKYQYSDNLSAIHIMWPFGRIGVVCLLVFVVVAVHGFLPKNLPDESQGIAPRAMALAAIMAGLTFIWSDIYMVMANLYLVPFTGRNLYLLAATSGGDLAEGLVLLLMLCLPWVLDRSGAATEANASGGPA